jgi:hypothetical protein
MFNLLWGKFLLFRVKFIIMIIITKIKKTKIININMIKAKAKKKNSKKKLKILKNREKISSKNYSD